jgi:glycosyltransferase involved in cell wall biosynthesis
VRILRHPVQKSCDTETFKKASQSLFSRLPELRADEDFLHLRNPQCPDLMAALVRRESEFDGFIFFSCIDRTSLEGIPCIRNKPVALFPVVLAEWQLQFSSVREMIRDADTLFFLSRSEQEAVSEHRPASSPSVLLRYGIPVHDVTKGLMRRKYGLILPYMLVAGRIEEGKDLEVVYDAYRDLRRRRLITLVLIGRQMMEIPRDEGIFYLGHLSQAEKRSALAEAVLTIHPAPGEMISSNLLDCLAQGTPTLASAKSAVFHEHTELGGGGLLYRDAADFVAKAEHLIDHLDQRRSMGRRGRRYVETCHSWSAVMDHFLEQVKEGGHHGQ